MESNDPVRIRALGVPVRQVPGNASNPDIGGPETRANRLGTAN